MNAAKGGEGAAEEYYHVELHRRSIQVLGNYGKVDHRLATERWEMSELLVAKSIEAILHLIAFVEFPELLPLAEGFSDYLEECCPGIGRLSLPDLIFIVTEFDPLFN